VVRFLPETGIWLRLGVVIGEHGIESWRNSVRRKM
jgi:hypothetical protein